MYLVYISFVTNTCNNKSDKMVQWFKHNVTVYYAYVILDITFNT